MRDWGRVRERVLEVRDWGRVRERVLQVRDWGRARVRVLTLANPDPNLEVGRVQGHDALSVGEHADKGILHWDDLACMSSGWC